MASLAGQALFFRPVMNLTGRHSPTKRMSSSNLLSVTATEQKICQYIQWIAQKNSEGVSYFIRFGKDTSAFNEKQITNLIDTALKHDDGQVLNALAFRFPYAAGRIISGLGLQHQNVTYHFLEEHAKGELAPSLTNLVDTSFTPGCPKLFHVDDHYSREIFAQNKKKDSTYRPCTVLLRGAERYQPTELDRAFQPI